MYTEYFLKIYERVTKYQLVTGLEKYFFAFHVGI